MAWIALASQRIFKTACGPTPKSATRSSPSAPNLEIPAGNTDDDLIRTLRLRLVVISQLSDENAAFHGFVDDPVFKIDSARPVSSKGVFQRFWLSNPGMRIPDNVFEELVDSFNRL